MMFDKAKDYIKQTLVSVTADGRPSSTKLIYVSTGLAGLCCAVLMSLVFCAVYVWKRVADAAFAASLGAMWTVAYGFVSNAHNKLNAADSQIAQQKVAPATGKEEEQ